MGLNTERNHHDTINKSMKNMWQEMIIMKMHL